jgi:SagB-type dehydrogenase family enzyme
LWLLSLPEDVAISAGTDGELLLLGPNSQLRVRCPSAGLRDGLRRLAAPGAAAGPLAEAIGVRAGSTGLTRWYYHLQQLAGRRLLRVTAHDGGRRLATLEPIAPGFVLAPATSHSQRRCVLSRFAHLRRRADTLALESPLSRARILLHDPRAAALVHALARPRTAIELGNRTPDLSAEVIRSLLGLLAAASMTCAVDGDGLTAEETDPSLCFWEFHDLLFHARSREVRHDVPLGATYPQAGHLDPPPALKPVTVAEQLDLYRPDLDHLQRHDPPFALVQERRRSERRYAAEPMTVRQLGEFLFRVAQVTGRQEAEVETPAGSMRMDFATRPYPAGGALYELDVYVIVNVCGGLSTGLYCYDPLGHGLGRLADSTPAVKDLLDGAALAAGLAPAALQVLLILTARRPRIAWKYSGLAYALILKHVGVVDQTMYLAATAMGLAPCALGVGNSDLFARVAGLDPYAETSVGEFLLGSKPRRPEPWGREAEANPQAGR